MRNLRVFTPLGVFLVWSGTLFGQAPDSGLVTVDRIFNSREFVSQRFGPARWVDEGSGYTTLERAGGGQGRDIVGYDTRSGDREVLVPAEKLTPASTGSPLEINDYQWSEDKSRLLIFTNTRRVWRTNTRGDYWVYGMADGSLRKLGGDADPSTLMFAKFSPDGRRVAYVRANDLYVEELTSGTITRLTSDGSRTRINGTFDWVYEEEFDLRDGFRWSPDGTMIAYWQLDATGVRDFFLINNTDSLYSYVIRKSVV